MFKALAAACPLRADIAADGFDVLVVDGIVNGVAKLVMACSAGLKGLQSGYIHNYAFGMAAGVVVIVAVYLFR